LHHNVLAIALANKLARIAWALLNKGRAFECVKTEEMTSRPARSSRRARGRQGAAWQR
jgi:transposase